VLQSGRIDRPCRRPSRVLQAMYGRTHPIAWSACWRYFRSRAKRDLLMSRVEPYLQMSIPNESSRVLIAHQPLFRGWVGAGYPLFTPMRGIGKY